MEELDRQQVVTLTVEETPPPSAIEQMMPLIAMVMMVGIMTSMTGELGEGV